MTEPIKTPIPDAPPMDPAPRPAVTNGLILGLAAIGCVFGAVCLLLTIVTASLSPPDLGGVAIDVVMGFCVFLLAWFVFTLGGQAERFAPRAAASTLVALGAVGLLWGAVTQRQFETHDALCSYLDTAFAPPSSGDKKPEPDWRDWPEAADTALLPNGPLSAYLLCHPLSD